jgi:hypothetical protein
MTNPRGAVETDQQRVALLHEKGEVLIAEAGEKAMVAADTCQAVAPSDLFLGC